MLVGLLLLQINRITWSLQRGTNDDMIPPRAADPLPTIMFTSKYMLESLLVCSLVVICYKLALCLM